MPLLGTYGGAAARAWRPSVVMSFIGLCVAGGGGGGTTVDLSLGVGGGGGAGGMRLFTGKAHIGVPIAIVVGAAGAPDNEGGDSSVGTFASCTGGGRGAFPGGSPGNGGSGGGCANGGGSSVGGTGIGGEGNDGGGGGGAGGGGAGAAGLDNVANGGVGVASSISGASVTYSKGGDLASGVAGATPGSGGGGGDGGSSTPSASGAAGIVILSYPGGTRGIGGTITSSGGWTRHTFTADDNFIRTI